MISSEQGKKEIVLPVTFEEYFRSFRLDELKRYLDVTEKYLQKAKSDFETSANEQAKKLSTANPNLRAVEIDDILGNDYWQYAETFPRILRSSFLVSVISLFENEVAQISQRIRRVREIPINLADLNGDLLNKVKMYCKLAGLPISFGNRTWNEINNYYMVRNCIVHNNGFISGFRDEKKMIAYAEKKEIVDRLMFLPSIRPRAIIALSEQFCEEAIETIQDFLVELEKKIAKTI
ncbi:hypothetical protein ACFLTR_00765 [Chloroflexota bacterium]